MFAILRTSETEFDRGHAARVVAPFLTEHVPDLARRLQASSLILLKDLSQLQAANCARALARHGIQCQPIRMDQILDLPTPVAIKSCALDHVAIRYSRQGVAHQIPWPDVGWIDMAEVGVKKRGDKASVTFPIHGHAERDRGMPGTFGQLPQRPLAIKWSPRIDVVTADMRNLLRIDLTKFNFRSTGLQTHPSRNANSMALCIALVTRAPQASLGPGSRWVAAGGVPCRQKVESDAIYDNLLQGRLTLTKRQAGIGDAQGALMTPLETPVEQARRLEGLHTVLRAIVEDGVISLDEMKELLRWLRNNRNTDLQEVKALIEIMQQITADKIVTKAERHELHSAIQQMLPEPG